MTVVLHFFVHNSFDTFVIEKLTGKQKKKEKKEKEKKSFDASRNVVA